VAHWGGAEEHYCRRLAIGDCRAVARNQGIPDGCCLPWRRGPGAGSVLAREKKMMKTGDDLLSDDADGGSD
jgi:hypothetical protein